MGEFILILVINFYYPYAPTSILFPSKEACENAKQQAMVEFKGSKGVCVPRNAS